MDRILTSDYSSIDAFPSFEMHRANHVPKDGIQALSVQYCLSPTMPYYTSVDDFPSFEEHCALVPNDSILSPNTIVGSCIFRYLLLCDWLYEISIPWIAFVGDWLERIGAGRIIRYSTNLLLIPGFGRGISLKSIFQGHVKAGVSLDTRGKPTTIYSHSYSKFANYCAGLAASICSVFSHTAKSYVYEAIGHVLPSKPASFSSIRKLWTTVLVFYHLLCVTYIIYTATTDCTKFMFAVRDNRQSILLNNIVLQRI